MSAEAASDIRRRVLAGETVLGLWSIVPSPMLGEVLSRGGFDFQILDMEHGSYDFRDIEDSIRALESAGCAPMVRVPAAVPTTVQRCLDFGAHGLVFPQISSAHSAREASETLLFNPRGRRGFNPFTRAGRFSGKISSLTPGLKDGFPLNVIIIETKAAAAAIRAIATEESVDVLYLGVYDMSVALGCAGDVGHPKVVRFVENAARSARRAGKAIGMMVRTPQEAKRAASIGATFLVYGVDASFIRDAAAQAVSSVRSELGAHR